MSTTFKNVMLLGAGGNVGKPVLAQFANTPFTVSVLTRPGSKSTFPSDINVVQAEYNAESLKAAFKGQDAVVSMIGSNALEEQLVVVEAAIAAGVKRIFPSEFGSDSDDPHVLEQVPFLKTKVDVIEHLKKHEDKIEWTGMINGFFFDWSLGMGLMGFDFKNKTATIIDSGKVALPTTTLASVGRSVVGALSHPAESKNKFVYVTSFVTNQLELLDIIEKATGDTYEKKHVNSKTLRDENMIKLQQGDYMAIVGLLQAHGFGEDGTADYTNTRELSNKLFGLPEEDITEEVKKVIAGL